MRALAAAIALATAACSAAPHPPPVLTAGTALVYESGGTTTTWRVEAMTRDVAHGGMTGCQRVRYAPGGPSRTAEARFTCARGDTLFAWDSRGGRWRATRPLRPGRSLEVPGRNGSVTRYTAVAGTVDQIGRHRVDAIETTIVTSDSALRVVRRLRERYAPALGTATRGTFEVTDSTSPTGWRIVQEFRLVAIRAAGEPGE